MSEPARLRRIQVAFVLTLAALAVIGVLAVRAIGDVRGMTRSAQEAARTARAVDALRISFAEAVTLHRGFLVSGSDSALRAAEVALRTTRAATDSLLRVLGPVGAAAATARDALPAMLDARQEDLRQHGLLANTGGLERARRDWVEGNTRSRTTTITAAYDELHDEVDRRLGAALRTQDAGSTLVDRFLWLGGALLGGVGLLGWLQAQGVATATRAAEARVQQELTRALAQEQVRLARIAEVAPVALHTARKDASGHWTFPYAADRFADLYGVDLATIRVDASEIFARIHPDDAEHLAGTIADSERRMGTWHCEWRYRHPTRVRSGWRASPCRSRRRVGRCTGMAWYSRSRNASAQSATCGNGRMRSPTVATGSGLGIPAPAHWWRATPPWRGWWDATHPP